MTFDISALNIIILSDTYCFSVSAAGIHALSGLGFMWESQSPSYLDSDKVKIEFNLEQATKAQRGSRGIAQLFL